MTDARAYALCRLNEYLSTLALQNIGEIIDLDRKKNFIIFELCVAFELGLYPWGDLPKEVFESSNEALKQFIGKSKKPRDYGIDCASLDLKKVAQAKWYKPNSNISFQDISTFYTLSTIVGAYEIIIATSADVKLAQLAAGLPIVHVCISDARFMEICTAALMSQTFDPVFMASYAAVAGNNMDEGGVATGGIATTTDHNRVPLILPPVNIIMDDKQWYPGFAIIVLLTVCILGVLVISFLA